MRGEGGGAARARRRPLVQLPRQRAQLGDGRPEGRGLLRERPGQRGRRRGLGARGGGRGLGPRAPRRGLGPRGAPGLLGPRVGPGPEPRGGDAGRPGGGRRRRAQPQGDLRPAERGLRRRLGGRRGRGGRGSRGGGGAGHRRVGRRPPERLVDLRLGEALAPQELALALRRGALDLFAGREVARAGNGGGGGGGGGGRVRAQRRDWRRARVAAPSALANWSKTGKENNCFCVPPPRSLALAHSLARSLLRPSRKPSSYLGMHQERHGVRNLVLAQRSGGNRGQNRRRCRRRRRPSR